jgi:hypothetical protein
MYGCMIGKSPVSLAKKSTLHKRNRFIVRLLLLAFLGILLGLTLTTSLTSELGLVVILYCKIGRSQDEHTNQPDRPITPDVTHVFVEILVIELVVVELFHSIVVLKSLTGKVIDGSWDDLINGDIKKGQSRIHAYQPTHRATHPLLQILSDLVIHLELLIQILEFFLVDVALLHGFHRGWLRRLEEVEEGVYRNDLLDHSSSVGVYRKQKS